MDVAPWIGPDAVLNNLFLKIGGEWDGFTVNPKEFHDAGDTVVVEARYTGTYKATGKSLDAQVTHVWRLRDGKIANFQQYVDTAQLQESDGRWTLRAPATSEGASFCLLLRTQTFHLTRDVCDDKRPTLRPRWMEEAEAWRSTQKRCPKR
jgi:hypothetical protein